MTTPQTVAVIQTGTANTASVLAAFGRMAVTTRVIRSQDEIDGDEPLVLPGVGSYQAAMRRLNSSGLVDPVKKQLSEGKPFLAICLGLQLLAEGSEESPGVSGLAVVPGTATRLPSSVTVPQMGWNRVNWPDGSQHWAWYANSYCLSGVTDSWEVAYSNYGRTFVAALRRPKQLACQFHPELSGKDGMTLLNEWWRSC